MRDIIKEIGIVEYKKDVKNIKNKDERREKLMLYVEKVYEFLKKQDISVCVVVLDLLFNYDPILSYDLLVKRNEKILRAQLVLEKLKGNYINFIKNDIEWTIKEDSYNWKYDIHRHVSKKQLNLLNKYLNENFNNEENYQQIEEMISKDVVLFLKGLENLHETFFSLKCMFPSRQKYIDFMFDDLEVNIELQNYIFNEVLAKNKNIGNYYYNNIIMINLRLLGKIKGLYKKSTDNVYDLIVYELIKEQNSKEKYSDIEIDNILKELFENNKNDGVSIHNFFNEISKRLNKRLNSLQRYRIEKNFFPKELKNINLIEICQKNLEKLLNESSDIDENIFEELGRYPEFLNQYDKFMEKFFYSTDINYQRKLIKILLVGLIERQKKIHKLDFEYVFYTLKHEEGGAYSDINNILYINPNFMEENDLHKSFVSVVDTVFHEIRHAIQLKEIKINKKFDYKNLVMSMDRILQLIDIDGVYYHKNYNGISYEYDARDIAYVDTMIFFKNFPNLQQKIQELPRSKKVDTEEKFNSFYIREDNNGNIKGIIDVFLEKINSCLAEGILSEANKEKYSETINQLKKYPVIENFFDIDLNNRKITIKSEEYFENKLKEFNLMPDCLEKREGIYSIKAFMHALNINKYLSIREEVLKKPKFEEMIENVGPAPSR